MKRPSTFKDWRRIRNKELFCLGQYVAFLFHFVGRGRRIPMTRELWQKLHRIRRIEKRMEVEFAAKDSTYYEALAEMIFEKHENEE